MEAHHPFVLKGGLIRGTEDTEGYVLIENREVPILNNTSWFLTKNTPKGGETFCLSRLDGTDKRFFLCTTSGEIG